MDEPQANKWKVYNEVASSAYTKHQKQIAFVLVGVTLLGIGIFLLKSDFLKSPKVEIIDESKTATESANIGELVVEISGQVEKPGVYKLPVSSRIDDALIAAGGLSATADREWVEKTLNRAAKIIDGQKIYIPAIGERTLGVSASATSGGASVAQSSGVTDSKMVNINTGSLKQLETLPGIGPKYGQNIIDNRPYSNLEELVSKKAISQSVFNKIKDLVSIY